MYVKQYCFSGFLISLASCCDLRTYKGGRVLKLFGVERIKSWYCSISSLQLRSWFSFSKQRNTLIAIFHSTDFDCIQIRNELFYHSQNFDLVFKAVIEKVSSLRLERCYEKPSRTLSGLQVNPYVSWNLLLNRVDISKGLFFDWKKVL
jgi:hypothetical protein